MRKLSCAAAGAAAAIALSGATVMPGSAAHDAVATTRHFTLVATGSHQVGKLSFVGTDRMRRAGNTVGFDAYSGRFYPRQNRGVIRASFALKGGTILARMHTLGFTPGGPVDFAGRITGGRGKYRGISGTITGHQPPPTSNKTFVTLTYTE
jgi:hypothetical protein